MSHKSFYGLTEDLELLVMMLTTRVQALRLNIRAVTWTKKKTPTMRTDINAITLTVKRVGLHLINWKNILNMIGVWLSPAMCQKAYGSKKFLLLI